MLLLLRIVFTALVLLAWAVLLYLVFGRARIQTTQITTHKNGREWPQVLTPRQGGIIILFAWFQDGNTIRHESHEWHFFSPCPGFLNRGSQVQILSGVMPKEPRK